MNKTNWIRKSLLVLGFVALSPNLSLAAGEADYIRDTLGGATVPAVIKESRFDFILHGDRLKSLYQLRNFQPIWVDSNRRPTQKVFEMKEAFSQAGRNGLVTKDYWDDELESLLAELQENPGVWNSFEFAMSEAMIRFATHLSTGRFDPVDVEEKVGIKRPTFAMYPELNAALNGNMPLPRAMDSFAPQHLRYRDLVTILAQTKRLKDQYPEWPALVSPGFPVKLGTKHAFVGQLRDRLNILGFTNNASGSNRELVDEELDTVLRAFQRVNRLDVDGVVGVRSEVIRNLNVTPNQRYGQVLVTMEKVRWLPRKMEDRFIFVNLASNQFKLFNFGQKIFDFATVNGQMFRSTPTMRTMLKEIILNPTWTVPTSIARADKLPEIKRNVKYLEDHKFIISESFGGPTINPYSVDWKSISPNSFNYVITQMPGYMNALGVVKFPLTNDHAIYLHDTNDRPLLKQAKRHQSSGCVRLEYPLELAAYLLEGTQWTMDKIKEAVPSAEEKYSRTPIAINLKDKALPVYLMYLTVERTDDGYTRFVEDVYGQDVRLAKALQNKKTDNELF